MKFCHDNYNMNLKDILFNQVNLSETQQVALKNVLAVCKERLWLQETGGTVLSRLDPGYTDDYDSFMTDEQIAGAKRSIEIMEQLLHANIQYDENHR